LDQILENLKLFDDITLEKMSAVNSFDYKINKHNHIETFGVLNKELESEDAYGKYILGLAYNYSF